MRTLRRIYNSEDGFTLIELLVVVIVLGILAGITVPRLMGVQERAKNAAIASAAGTIRTAMDIFYVENERYPNATSEITNWASLCSTLNSANLDSDSTSYNIQGITYTNTAADTFLLEFDSNNDTTETDTDFWMNSKEFSSSTLSEG